MNHLPGMFNIIVWQICSWNIHDFGFEIPPSLKYAPLSPKTEISSIQRKQLFYIWERKLQLYQCYTIRGIRPTSQDIATGEVAGSHEPESRILGWSCETTNRNDQGGVQRVVAGPKDSGRGTKEISQWSVLGICMNGKEAQLLIGTVIILIIWNLEFQSFTSYLLNRSFSSCHRLETRPLLLFENCKYVLYYHQSYTYENMLFTLQRCISNSGR